MREFLSIGLSVPQVVEEVVLESTVQTDVVCKDGYPTITEDGDELDDLLDSEE